MTLAILTPSYRPDLDGLVRLHESILRHTDNDVVHHVIVPRSDLDVFGPLASSRLALWTEADFLPPHFVLTDSFADLVRRFDFLPAKARIKAINTRKPWPPIRGWILQQVVKLQAAARIEADVIAVIDSDVVLIRSVTETTFRRDSAVRLYRNPDGISADMERHIKWDQAAARLLRVPGGGQNADYIAGLVSWDPSLVADCLRAVEEVACSPWGSVVGSELHFSEFMLYGTYVHTFGTAEQRSFVSDQALCHSYWDPEPLSMANAVDFVDRLAPEDVAVHIQSNSRTPVDVLDFVFRAVSSV